MSSPAVQTPPTKRRSIWKWLLLFIFLTPLLLIIGIGSYIWFVLPGQLTARPPAAQAAPAKPDPELLNRKMQAAAPLLMAGKEATITLSDAEIASVLAGGLSQGGEMTLHSIKFGQGTAQISGVVNPELPPVVPAKFQGPYNVSADLQMEARGTELHGQLKGLKVGTIEIPLAVIQSLLESAQVEGLDPNSLAVNLDIGPIINEALQGHASLKALRAESGQLVLVLTPAKR